MLKCGSRSLLEPELLMQLSPQAAWSKGPNHLLQNITVSWLRTRLEVNIPSPFFNDHVPVSPFSFIFSFLDSSTSYRTE